MSASPPLVAFDFDGTLTVRDSFTAFLRWRGGEGAWLGGLLRLTPAFAAYALDRDRGRLKSAAVSVFLHGLPREALTRDAETFAETAWDRLMRPDALAAWAAHRADGDTLVIVTASPEEIVAPFAERLGAFALIGSRLAWTADDRMVGTLAGENCRGAEKVVRLKARFGEAVRLSCAYGDTAGDREMLALADRGEMRRFTARP